MSNTILGIIASSGGAAASTSSYESIASATGTGSSGTITFSSIPSTYKHLQIRGMGRASGATSAPMYIYLQLNAGSGYAWHYLKGNGASAAASGGTGATYAQLAGGGADGSWVGANILSGTIIDIIDYASTTKNKTIRSFAGVDPNDTDGSIAIASALATGLGTTAVTEVNLIAPSGNWTTQTTFALYGIKG
jgi:hypothetical protein